MKETLEEEISNKLQPKNGANKLNAVTSLRFLRAVLFNPNKKCKCSVLITLLGNQKFLNQCYGVSCISLFPTLSAILTLLDGWVIEKKYVINKSKTQTISFFIKVLAQTLACNKKQRCIQNPVKHLWRSSSTELEGLPAPHLGWGCLVFVTVNQVEVFFRNITPSSKWIQLTQCASFKMAQYANVKWWATDKTLLLNTY